jgi:hypothetical protein
MHQIASTVEAQPYYAPLFKKAFGSEVVTEDLVLEAVANFVNAMGSYQSKLMRRRITAFPALPASLATLPSTAILQALQPLKIAEKHFTMPIAPPATAAIWAVQCCNWPTTDWNQIRPTWA